MYTVLLQGTNYNKNAKNPSFVDISGLVGNNDNAVRSNCEPGWKRVLIHAGLHRYFAQVAQVSVVYVI